MGFDLTGIWETALPQIFFVLGAVGIVAIIAGITTQNVWVGLGTFVGVVLVGVAILILVNLQVISETIKNLVIVGSIIPQLKGVIPLWNIITLRS